MPHGKMTAAPEAAADEKSAPQGAGSARARTNKGSLDSLTIRRRTTGEDAAARARLMRRLRVALPILALVLIASFLLNARQNRPDGAFLEDFADVEATPRNLRTARPEFSGVDARGNPYKITADVALQKVDGGKIVDLQSPRAVTSAANGQSVVAATAGVFDADAKRLELREGVQFEHQVAGVNYVLKTPSATYTIDDRIVVSEAGIDGEGSDGERLKADRMNADDKTGVLVFEGNVSMRIFPRQTDAAAEGAAAPDKPGER